MLTPELRTRSMIWSTRGWSPDTSSTPSTATRVAVTRSPAPRRRSVTWSIARPYRERNQFSAPDYHLPRGPGLPRPARADGKAAAGGHHTRPGPGALAAGARVAARDRERAHRPDQARLGHRLRDPRAA